MGRLERVPRRSVALTGGLFLWLGAVLVVGASAPVGEGGPSSPHASILPPPVAQDPAGQGGYAGEAACLECHEDQGKSLHGTPHARALNPRTPSAGQSCESCHGPGKQHIDAGGEGFILNPVRMKPRAASDTCTTCHNRSEHVFWDGGKHDSRNMTCVTCHSVHAPKSEKGQLKTETQQETCVQCHRTQVSKLHRSAHMPVREGKMECSTCHNPHGSQNVKMLREGNSINESCVSCHAEKRGPFLWEHAPVRNNCTTCHDPHGSNNDRMLVARQPMLCQRCHVHTRHPATVYDNTALAVAKNNRIVGRSCVNCHSQIHGSNHPTSGKVFVR
jgi:DmsE family decaheme c-type cytochrome